MLFSSFAFVFAFLPITLLGFYALKSLGYFQSAKVFLILASLFFYGYFKVEYIFILIFSVLINFTLANLILRQTSKNSNKNARNNKFLLYGGIFFNLALLGGFKYTDFLLENFNLFSQILNLDFNIPLPHILLPLGLSFITFQQIAFLVDCYKRSGIESLIKVKHIDFIDYALFISFFPQLIAGPIVHHKEMMPQFASLLHKGKAFINWEYMAKGLFIFSVGLFKKIYVADTFALWANKGFWVASNGGTLNIFEAWATSLSYTFQIYFDFSGYCDMAIGLGLFFGIVLPINFDSPYKSLNIAEFWRRWHMTLGRFLKDYLYIPLGGNRVGKLLNLRNLFIVAFLSGIWHGAGWGFVIWGVLHGSAMCIHRIYTYIKPNWKFFEGIPYKILAWFITFNFLNFAWIFFRAENLREAFSIIQSMFGITWVELPYKFYSRLKNTFVQLDGTNETLFMIILAFIVCLGFKNGLERMRGLEPNWFNVFVIIALLYFALSKLIAIPYVEFIYFNF